MTYLSPLTAEDEARANDMVRPGESVRVPVRVMDGASAIDAELETAYCQMVDHLTNAWRRPPAGAQAAPAVRADDAGQSAEDAYSAMVERTCNAWKRG